MGMKCIELPDCNDSIAVQDIARDLQPADLLRAGLEITGLIETWGSLLALELQIGKVILKGTGLEIPETEPEFRRLYSRLNPERELLSSASPDQPLACRLAIPLVPNSHDSLHGKDTEPNQWWHSTLLIGKQALLGKQPAFYSVSSLNIWRQSDHGTNSGTSLHKELRLSDSRTYMSGGELAYHARHAKRNAAYADKILKAAGVLEIAP